MKKVFILLVCIGILFNFGSCASESGKKESGSSVAETTNKVEDQPPLYFDIGFDTYEELFEYFRSGEPELIKNHTVDFSEYPKYISLYRDIKNNLGIYVPAVNNDFMKLRDEKGFPNIDIHTNGYYNRPWFFYFGESTGNDLIVHFVYLTEEEQKAAQGLSYSEFLKSFSPNDPRPDNNSSTTISNVYDKELKLADRTVSAMVYEFNDDRRIRTHFIYDDILVWVIASPEIGTSEWFASLSFKVINFN